MDRAAKEKYKGLINWSVTVSPLGTPVSYNLCLNRMIGFPSILSMTLNEITSHHKRLACKDFFDLPACVGSEESLQAAHRNVSCLSFDYFHRHYTETVSMRYISAAVPNHKTIHYCAAFNCVLLSLLCRFGVICES